MAKKKQPSATVALKVGDSWKPFEAQTLIVEELEHVEFIPRPGSYMASLPPDERKGWEQLMKPLRSPTKHYIKVQKLPAPAEKMIGETVRIQMADEAHDLMVMHVDDDADGKSSIVELRHLRRVATPASK